MHLPLLPTLGLTGGACNVVQVMDFVGIQEQYIKDQAAFLDSKNLEVENAVKDMLVMVENMPLEDPVRGAGAKPHKVGISPEARQPVLAHYNRLMYNAILNSMRASFNTIKKKVGKAPSKGFLAALQTAGVGSRETPFFVADVALDNGSTQAACPLWNSLAFLASTSQGCPVAWGTRSRTASSPPNAGHDLLFQSVILSLCPYRLSL